MELRGKPVGVTNGLTGTCIITASYEARAYGIKTGTRVKEARRLCPDFIQLPARPKRYAEVSPAIMDAMQAFTPDVEIFSVDECFLDITRCQGIADPVTTAHRVEECVYNVSGLHCSIGLSGDKTTAKYAAKLDKPNGFTVIPPWEAKERLRDVPVTDLCGINKGIGSFLAARGVHVCGDMAKLPISVLGQHFGNPGRRIWYMCQGRDPEPVTTNIPPPKTIGHGKVLPPDTHDREVLEIYLSHMSEKVALRLRANQLEAQVFAIGVRAVLGWITKKYRTTLPTQHGPAIMALCKKHLTMEWNREGIFQVQITALDPRMVNTQVDMFAEPAEKQHAVDAAVDDINNRWGEFTISPAKLLRRSDMPNVISPAWKPYGHRQTI